MEEVEQAHQAVKNLLIVGHPLVVAWSGGKDSSCLLNITLVAASEVKRDTGDCPPIFVTHADTLIENPEVHQYALAEIKRIEAFAKSAGLNVSVMIARPRTYEHFAVQLIGRRALPTYPDSAHRKCTWDWKVKPMQRLNADILKKCSTYPLQPVRLIGTRFEESSVRARKMHERNDSATVVRTDSADGSASLSPICELTSDDVWVYLAEVRDGIRPGYSDFLAVFQLYKDASGET